MKATPTLSNTQLPKCNRWPKSLNPAKPLPKAVKNQTPAQEPNCNNLSSTNRYTNINLYLLPKIQTSVPDVVIPHMHKDLIAQLRSISVNIVPTLDTSPGCALPNLHTHSNSNTIEVSQNRHIKLLYLNIIISHIKTHTNVIMMTSL